jgi:hypothetical protein
LICKPHFERTGQRVPATRLVVDEWWCNACADGKSFNREVMAESHRKKAEAQKKRFADPEVRRLAKERANDLWKDAARRARQSESQRARRQREAREAVTA